MSKLVKQLIESELGTRFGDVDQAVVIDYGGLDAEETSTFRATLREQGISVNVVKNTLIRRVFAERGLELEPEAFSGPTAIVWGAEDAVTAGKAVHEWRKEHKKDHLRFKAGLLNGEVLGAEAAEKLTTMPSTQDLRQMLVAAIAGPLTATVGVLSNTLSAIPQVIQAIADKKKEGE